ncbi:hypothetical protein Tco_0925512 [Tanacetum coccineum]|uniref:Uncharacterized protein n=1 Tax=Tanacetum coccineum TaxID=301880 RepID=A0ABQ5D7W9_9ASTR
MENEHELSYKTLTRVYLGSYEHYKSVGAEVEHPEPGSTLRGQGILVIKVRTGGGDVVRLGAELERLWCKVEVCGGVCGGDLAAATLRLQGRDVASFRAKR